MALKMNTWQAEKNGIRGGDYAACGVVEQAGVFTATTLSASKDFRSFGAARKWLGKSGYSVNDTPDAA